MNRSVKASAVLLCCYAGLLVLEAVAMGVARGWSDRRHLVQHILGALAYFGLGWAVLRKRRWAWWVVVIVVGLLSALGLAATGLVFLQPGEQRSGVLRQMEELFQFGSATLPLFVLSVAVLLGSVVSLLTREARDTFFRS